MKGHKSHHHGKHKASGGRTDMKVSGNPDVFKEAEGKEHKKGGAVKGKKVEMHGHKPHHRMDRPGRKRGGGVGADTSPLTSAHRVTSPAKDGETEHGAAD